LLLLTPKQILTIAAVADIAIHARDEPAATREIAARLNLQQPRYLEASLQALVHEGVLAGVRGPSGGYRLGREPRLISAADILRPLSESGLKADPEEDIPSSLAMGIAIAALRPVEEAVSEVLGRLTVDMLVRRASG
jgi:Rrf2 family iron-sulfur cluster assembly transcriptional regulator